MHYLKANTQVKIVVGPFVDTEDGLTPETGVTLSGADEAELMKHDASSVTDISSATWSAITSMDGYYNLTLTTSLTDTEGMLTVVVQDDSVCLPVRRDYMVLSEAAYDSMFAAKDTGFMDVNIKAVSEDTTAADNLELACDNYSATRGLSGTALPAAAADAAGGLPISDNGGLDLDTQLAYLDATISSRGTADPGDAMDLVNDSITSAKFDESTAFPLAKADSGSDELARTGTDGDTLEDLSDQIDGIATQIGTAGDGLTSLPDVSVDEIKASALADLFNTDSGTDSASAVSGSVVKEIADAVWDEDITDHTTTDSTGEALGSAVSGGVSAGTIAGAVWDAATSSYVDAGSFGKLVNDNIDAPLSTIDDNVDDIKAKTNNLPSDPADQSAVEAAITSAHSTTDGLITTADTVIDLIYGIVNSGTFGNSALKDLIDLCSTHSAADVKTAIEAGGGSIALIKAVTDALTPAAAAKMAISAGTMIPGEAAAGTLSTTEMTTNLTFTAADQMNGRIIVFAIDTTTAALRGQATDISATTVLNGKLGFTALTTAPSAGDTFIIV